MRAIRRRRGAVAAMDDDASKEAAPVASLSLSLHLLCCVLPPLLLLEEWGFKCSRLAGSEPVTRFLSPLSLSLSLLLSPSFPFLPSFLPPPCSSLGIRLRSSARAGEPSGAEAGARGGSGGGEE